MKTTVLVLLGLSAQFCAAWASDDLPKAATFARYEGMMNKSPFAVATAVAPAPVAASFAKDLYIANAAKLADQGVVTLNSSVDKNLKEYLTTREPNANGYSISNIEWSDRVGATKVTIAKDGQFATLTFNQALLTQPVANAPIQQAANPPVPQPVVQPQPAVVTPPPNSFQNANTIKPAPIPTLPTPPPRVRGVIQRNPSPVPGVPPVMPNNMQQTVTPED